MPFSGGRGCVARGRKARQYYMIDFTPQSFLVAPLSCIAESRMKVFVEPSSVSSLVVSAAAVLSGTKVTISPLNGAIDSASFLRH
jgi:hypothetical protein